MGFFQIMPGNCISLSSECKNLTISFVKGWGRSYRRQEVTDCPAWLEILLWLVAYESKFHANVTYLTFVKKYSVLLKYIQYRVMSHIIWLIFMTHQFNSIWCIFCDLHGCHLMATLWSLLSDFTSTSFKNTYPLCIKTSSQNLCLNYDFQ